MGGNKCKLSILGLGLSLGIVWGLGMLIMGLGATYCDWATPVVELVGSVYIGYKATLVGSLVGFVMGFVDAFISGVLIAFFYNLCCCKCSKSCD